MTYLKKIWTEGYPVYWYDTDQHGHVNSTRFIDWSIDALPTEWHRSHRISSMIINYLSEVRPDETIRISKGAPEGHSQFIEGVREDGKAIFRMRMDWEVP